MKLPLFIALLLSAFAAFAQTDYPDPPPFTGVSEAKVKVEANWLLLPMNGGERYNKVKITDADGNTVFAGSVLLADGNAQWHAPVDVSKFKGGEITFSYQTLTKEPSFRQVDELGYTDHSKDRGRPTSHLTPKFGYMGDFCGLVKVGGLWHAYFLFNPYAMTPHEPYFIAHAVSDDLVNWDYKPDVMRPVFSDGAAVYPVAGSAFFDKNNKSGFFDSGSGVILIVEKSDGSTVLVSSEGAELAVLSGLGGKSVGAPSLSYLEKQKLWLVVKCVSSGGSNVVEFYTSRDLSNWKLSGSVAADMPSPTLFETFVSASDTKKYVLWGGDGSYLVGDFDGGNFRSDFSKPARLFYGDARGAQIWQNVPSGRILATARVDQPGDLMRDVGQSFSQSASIPWELRLADTKRGLRLRASVPQEIVGHFGRPEDALGIPQLQFRSNVFSLPEAVGNNFAVVFTFDTSELVGFSLRAGVAKFGYSKISESYEITRIETNKYAIKATDPRPDGFTSAMIFLDTYSAEAFFLDGSAVLFMGDSYLNPEQEIKVGCNGEIFVDKVSRIPINRVSPEQRAKAAQAVVDSVNKK